MRRHCTISVLHVVSIDDGSGLVPFVDRNIGRNRLHIEEVPFQQNTVEDQRGPFYSIDTPIKILHISMETGGDLT
jgi:hypothetical protein